MEEIIIIEKRLRKVGMTLIKKDLIGINTNPSILNELKDILSEIKGLNRTIDKSYIQHKRTPQERLKEILVKNEKLNLELDELQKEIEYNEINITLLENGLENGY